MSWETLKKAEEMLAAAENKGNVNYEYCALVASVFETPAAKELLDAWKDMVINNSHLNLSLPPEHLFVAEGQNNFIRHILSSIELHKRNLEKKRGSTK